MVKNMKKEVMSVEGFAKRLKISPEEFSRNMEAMAALTIKMLENKREVSDETEVTVKLGNLKKALLEVKETQAKEDKEILENSLEEVYRELHNGVNSGYYSISDLAFGTRMIEEIRKMNKADYNNNSAKGYFTKREREAWIREDERKKTLERVKGFIDENLNKIISQKFE